MSNDAGPEPKPIVLVLTHRVKRGAEAAYASWLRRIRAAEDLAPGFIGREDIPPVEGVLHQESWTSLVRFDSEQSLNSWTKSAAYQRLLEEVESLCVHGSKVRIDSVFDGWFTAGKGDAQIEQGFPPTWKMMLAIVLALYPSISLISYILTPLMVGPFAVKLLVNNLLAVACVSWITLPIVRRILGSWLAPTSDCSLALNLFGTLGIIVALSSMVLLTLLLP